MNGTFDSGSEEAILVPYYAKRYADSRVCIRRGIPGTVDMSLAGVFATTCLSLEADRSRREALLNDNTGSQRGKQRLMESHYILFLLMTQMTHCR